MREHSISSPETFRFLETIPLHDRFVDTPLHKGAPMAPAILARSNLISAIRKGGGPDIWRVVRCPYCGGTHDHDATGEDITDPRQALGGRLAHCDRQPWVNYALEYRLIGIERRSYTQFDEIEAFFPRVSTGFDIQTQKQVVLRLAGRIRTVPPQTQNHVTQRANNAKRQPIPRELRASIWAKSQGRCYFCGVQTNPYDTFAIDHLVPVADGGTNDPKNLVPSCKACNGAKGAMSLTSFRMKRGGGLFWFEIAMVGGSGMQP